MDNPAEIETKLDNPDIIITMDSKGNYKNIWTGKPEDLIAPSKKLKNKNVTEVLPENIAKKFNKYIKLAIEKNKLQKFNYELEFDSDKKYFEAILINFDDKNILSCIKNITDRKQIIKKLIENERYYRAAFENTGTATFIINKDTTIAEANSRFVQLSGYSKEEIEENMSWTDIVSKKDLPRMKKYHNLRRKNRDAAPKSYEFNFVNKKNEIKKVLIHIDMIPDTDKSIASLLDITDRKKMENKLRSSEKRFRNLFENFPTVIWEEDLSELKKFVDKLNNKHDNLKKYLDKNPEKVEKALQMIKIIDVNETAVDFYNAQSKKEIYENADKLFTKKAKEVFKKIMIAIARGRVHFSSDSETKTIDGQIKDIRLEWKIPEGTEKDYSSVYLATFDVSKRKIAERTIKRQNVYFQQLFDNSPEGIVLLDNREQIIKVNESFEKLFGYKQNEIEGMRINNLIVPEDKREEGEKISGKVKEGNTVEKESVRETKSGEKIHVSIKGYPILYEGKQLGVYGIYNDISVRKKEEEKIKYLYLHDQLTDLYNRRYFAEERDRLDKSRNLPISIIVTDMDGLKEVNDNFGHKKGDQYLKIIADIISHSVREADIVARIGGDEFAILLPGANREVARKIEARIQKKCEEKNKSLDAHLGLSTGSATKSKPSENLFDKFKKADKKMYKMKNNKKY